MRLSLLIVFQLFTFTLAATVKNLVVFGDSNSDVNDRWSDGPLWSEYLALGWNASLYSFAFSGSVCDNEKYRIPKEEKVPSLRDQLEGYYNLNLNLNPNETVYAFWIGSQDIHEMSKRHGRQSPVYEDITDCIGQQLRAARKVFLSDRFLVLNIPPLGEMPYYKDTDAGFNQSQITREINKALERDVANLNKHHHALEMDYVDLYSLVNDILIYPDAFDFKNPFDSYIDTCLDNSDCEFQPRDYLWWDRTHFTSAFHKAVARSIIESQSYMPSINFTEELEKKLINKKSKFHSKAYKVGPNTGKVDEQARLYDLEKAPQNTSEQPPLDEDYVLSEESNPVFLISFVFIFLVIAIVVFIKYPPASLFSWCSPGRGKFTPVRNEEV